MQQIYEMQLPHTTTTMVYVCTSCIAFCVRFFYLLLSAASNSHTHTHMQYMCVCLTCDNWKLDKNAVAAEQMQIHINIVAQHVYRSFLHILLSTFYQFSLLLVAIRHPIPSMDRKLYFDLKCLLGQKLRTTIYNGLRRDLIQPRA